MRRRCRAHARSARECARGRNGRSSRAGRNLPAASARGAGLQAVLVVGDADALVGRQVTGRLVRTGRRQTLVGLAAGTAFRIKELVRVHACLFIPLRDRPAAVRAALMLLPNASRRLPSAMPIFECRWPYSAAVSRSHDDFESISSSKTVSPVRCSRRVEYQWVPLSTDCGQGCETEIVHSTSPNRPSVVYLVGKTEPSQNAPYFSLSDEAAPVNGRRAAVKRHPELDPLVECAPWDGQDQAADLTVCRAW